MVLLTEEVFREKDFKAMLFNIKKSTTTKYWEGSEFPLYKIKAAKGKEKKHHQTPGNLVTNYRVVETTRPTGNIQVRYFYMYASAYTTMR
jgi:hypothetical protein